MISFVDRHTAKSHATGGAKRAEQGKVAVVGSGISGLVSAYYLAKQGVEVTVFDAGQNPGGKIRTSGNKYSGRRFEYGAEFVDSDDHTLLKLCEELKVPVGATSASDATGIPQTGDMLYHVENKIYTEEQVKKWFAPVAPKLQELKSQLRDKKGHWTDKARELDAMSMTDFLQQLEKDGADKRLITIFSQSYKSEVGNDPSRLSALNFIDCVNTDTSKFEPFGVSDEAFKIEGGTQALTDALHKKCEEMGVQFNYGQPVKHLDKDGEKAVVQTELGSPQTFDHVVIATSLPALKHISGLENVGFDKEQVAWLNSMQHVNAVKIGLATKGDAWEHCPIPSDGSFISDSSFQCSWAVSSEASQLFSPAAPSPHGMVMMLVGGVDEHQNLPELVEKCKADFAKVLGKPVDDIFDNAVPPEFTVSRSDKNGCYISPAPGQYVELCTSCKQQPDGPASLVGSHVPITTAVGSKLGFMECGASSAHEQALAIAHKVQRSHHSHVERTLAQTAPVQTPPGMEPTIVPSSMQLTGKTSLAEQLRNWIPTGGGSSRA